MIVVAELSAIEESSRVINKIKKFLAPIGQQFFFSNDLVAGLFPDDLGVIVFAFSMVPDLSQDFSQFEVGPHFFFHFVLD